MKYYTDTILPIRWTSQHNCGENNNCQFIIQYSCEGELGLNVRDGYPQNTNGNTCTETIPEKTDKQIDNYLKYGKNEEFSYYQRCKNRKRNPFLFTADQKLKGNSATYTRQNPNGNRYGFECPEERDYYPYWGESDWKDIAILTSDTSMCDYYTRNSRCNIEKHECIGSTKFSDNKEHCEKHGGLWYTYPRQKCQDTPICMKAPTSTINRLGIEKNSTVHTTFNWKLPNEPKENCVLRIRYNISTNETPWNYTYLDNNKLKNNPVINTTQGVPIRLAVNTAQYGRTFEDRGYTFDIIKRDDNLNGKKIHNVNVQGKRGNIAQVRNCVEYDFVPNKLFISDKDYLHFQFIGSDYNPLNNDGEGRAGTDRSNVVYIDSDKDNFPGVQSNNILDNDVLYQLASLNQPIHDREKCYTYEELTVGNKRNDKNSLKNCALLNRADVYFNMKPIKPSRSGKMKAMSSRNNNFSNRGQKLTIVVSKDNSNDNSIDSNKPADTSKITYLNTMGIVMISIASVLIISIIVIKRKDISKFITNTRRALSSTV